MMLDSARPIMTPSARSDVPPFMVMDVMAAAARIEAAGGQVIHMEVGQPAVGRAVAGDRGGAGGARQERARLHRSRSAFRRCARASRGTMPRPIGLPVSADRVIVTTGSSAGFILAFLSMFEPGDRVAIANPGYPPYRHILTALGCEPVLIETDAATRFAITGESLRAAHAKKPLAGVLVASPANPTGTMMTPEALAALIRVADERRHPLHLRRNLSRARLRHAGRDRGAAVGERGRHQLVLEILLHDRLAHRLDGGAAGAGAADRPAARQSRDLGADAVADRGGGGVRGPRRARRDQARLRGQPENPDRRIAEGGARRNFCRSTARSISTPTSPNSRTTVSISPSACWKRRMWRRRRASISIRSTAGISSASATPARPPT